VFAAASANLAAFVADGDAAHLSFSAEQRDQVGDAYARRHLDPKARPQPQPNASQPPAGRATDQGNRAGAADKKGENSEKGEKGRTPAQVAVLGSQSAIISS
jgi:hypothetical protein